MNTNFIEKTLSSLVEQQMNISNAVLQRQPSSYEMIPSKQNVAFHNWEEYKRLGLKWGEPIVIVRIVSNNVFYLEYINGRYEEKGMVLLEEEELKKLILQKTIYIEDKSVFFNKAMPENSSKRPDVRIHPTDDTMVLIDAKAPMMKFDDYFEAIDEDNQKKISTLKTDLAKHIVKRVDELADKKYSDAKGAFDHVLMFLPTEEHVQVAREATQLIQVNIDQYAFDKKIYISGPRSILRDLEWAEKLLKMRRSYEMERGMLETIKPLFKTIKVMTDHLQEMTRSSNTTIKANDKLNKTFLNSFIKTLDKLSSEGLDDENIDKALNNFKKIENIELETIMEPENQNNIKESKLNS